MRGTASDRDEHLVVRDRRFAEARAAGLTEDEARIVALDTSIDIGVLRKLVAAGVDPKLIAKIIVGNWPFSVEAGLLAKKHRGA